MRWEKERFPVSTNEAAMYMGAALTLPSMVLLTSVMMCCKRFLLMMAMLKVVPDLSLSCQCLQVFATYVVRMRSSCHVDILKG